MPVPGQKMHEEDVKDKLAAVLLTVHMCKPLVNLLHKQPLRPRKCGDQLYHLQDLANSGLTSLPAVKIMPKQQNSKAMKWSYNSLNAARNFEKTSWGTQAAHSPTNLWTRWWQQQKNLPWEKKTLVARVQLHNMCQDWDEMIRSLSARLQGQVSVCKFLIKYPGCDRCKLHQEHHLWCHNMQACKQQNPNRPSWQEKTKTWH